MKSASFHLERAKVLLERTVPDRTVSVVKRRNGDFRVRADLVANPIAKYVHLDPESEVVVLRWNPGDTLTQARSLYARPELVHEILDLQEQGWGVRPNFHFGYIARGLTWTKSHLDAEAYVSYWLDRIHEVKPFPRDAWKADLDRLIQAGVFDDADLEKFNRDFVRTKRMYAAPRPGLLVERSWSWLGERSGLQEDLISSFLSVEDMLSK